VTGGQRVGTTLAFPGSIVVGFPAEEVAGLTLEDLTKGGQRREADCLGAAVLEDCEVRKGYADAIGEVPHRPLSSGFGN